MSLPLWRGTIYRQDHLITMLTHLRTVHIWLWEESLLALKHAHEGGGPTRMENLAALSKEKPGSPALCSLEVSPNVFKGIHWCFL